MLCVHERGRRGARSAIAAVFGATLPTLGSDCAVGVYSEPVHGHAACGVPAGHLPPPGACTLWYPHLPPGQQAPPGDCHALRHHAPADACLVYGE